MPAIFTLTHTSLYRFSSIVAARMRTIGGQSIDCAKPLRNQITARAVGSPQSAIAVLSIAVAESPIEIILCGFILSPKTPLIICPAPYDMRARLSGIPATDLAIPSVSVIAAMTIE